MPATELAPTTRDDVRLTLPSHGSSSSSITCSLDQRHRFLVPWLSLVMLLAVLDRSNLSFAALTMKSELGMSDAQYGFGSSVLYVGYVITQVPSVLLAKRIGGPAALAAIMLIWSACALCFPLLSLLTSPVPIFYVLRIALGAAEGGLVPIIYYCLSAFLNNDADRTVAFGQVLSASAFSTVIGGLLAAAIMQLDGCLGIRGWQWVFVAEGVPSFIAALATPYVLGRSPPLPQTPTTSTHSSSGLASCSPALLTLTDWRVGYLACCVFLLLQALWGEPAGQRTSVFSGAHLALLFLLLLPPLSLSCSVSLALIVSVRAPFLSARVLAAASYRRHAAASHCLRSRGCIGRAFPRCHGNHGDQFGAFRRTSHAAAIA